MYLEILEKAVADYISSKTESQHPIIIVLTPFIYKVVQIEINDSLEFKSEIPIEEFEMKAFKIHNRTITIEKGEILDSKFEMRMVEHHLTVNSISNNNSSNLEIGASVECKN